MEKKSIYVLLVIILFLGGCMSLTAPSFPEDFFYNEVIESSFDSETLWVALNQSLALSINDAEESIEFSDKKHGKIIANIHLVEHSRGIRITYKTIMVFSVLDKKYRIEIKPMEVEYFVEESYNAYFGYSIPSRVVKEKGFQRMGFSPSAEDQINIFREKQESFLTVLVNEVNSFSY